MGKGLKRVVCTVINDLTYDQRMIRICGSLSAEGYDVELIGRELPESKPLSDRAWKQTRLKCYFNKGKLFYLEFNIRLLIRHFFSKAQIIHAVDLDTLLPAFIHSRIKHSILVYDAHEIFTEVPELLNRPLTRKAWLSLERWILPQLTNAITVGEQLAAYYKSTYGIQMAVVRNTPLKQQQHVYSPDINRFFLYQGALNKGRGLEQMIEAMKEIDARMVIAGEGDLSAELREKVSRLGLSHKIHFTGFIQPEELSELTSRAWAGINVSESLGLSYYLSLNNKCFDYIQAGLPAITNPFPEYLRLNENYQTMIFANANVHELREACNRLLENKVLHRQLSDNCMKASTELNWEKEQSNLVRFYEEIQ
jgi:glycosyltransferase involved in cell wall biosynthesis